MSLIHYIVPTRGRPGNAKELIEAWRDTATACRYANNGQPGGPAARLYFAVDQDDPELAAYRYVFERAIMGGIDDLNWILINNKGLLSPPYSRLGEILNTCVAAMLESPGVVPTAIGFMGDDHRPRTEGWDHDILQALDRLGTGIVYGNDLVQGDNLPTAVAMTADIPRTLGYLVPPDLSHMYLDNYWKDLGQRIGRLQYLADVVIEHCHPIASKAPWDLGYRAVNNNMGPDAEVYHRYLREGGLDADAEKIKGIL